MNKTGTLLIESCGNCRCRPRHSALAGGISLAGYNSAFPQSFLLAIIIDIGLSYGLSGISSAEGKSE